MDFLQTVNFFDANSIISTLGLIGVLAIIFMETGLLIGLRLFDNDVNILEAGTVDEPCCISEITDLKPGERLVGVRSQTNGAEYLHKNI
jgi:hypothetical protein